MSISVMKSHVALLRARAPFWLSMRRREWKHKRSRMFISLTSRGSPLFRLSIRSICQTLMSNNARYEIKEVGVFTPKMLPQEKINPGDVGYFIANIKSTADMKIGDTITDQRHSAREPLPGFQEIHPMVFSGIYPINTGDFEHLKTAIAKLRLNDSAFVYQPESSVALGFGFRCGFLGLLHMEIIQERLRREYNMDIIATSPSVVHEVGSP